MFGPSLGERSGSGCVRRKGRPPRLPRRLGQAARPWRGCRRWHCPSPPGSCTLCVASKTTGTPSACICGMLRMSFTAGHSRRMCRARPARCSGSRSIAACRRRASCPTGRDTGPSSHAPAGPYSAAATSKSVCRARKAGICSKSQTSAAGAACSGRWISVVTGRPVVSLRRPARPALAECRARERNRRSSDLPYRTRLEDQRQGKFLGNLPQTSRQWRA